MRRKFDTDLAPEFGEDVTGAEKERVAAAARVLVDFTTGTAGRSMTYTDDAGETQRVELEVCPVCESSAVRIEGAWRRSQEKPELMTRQIMFAHKHLLLNEKHVDDQGVETDSAVVIQGCHLNEYGKPEVKAAIPTLNASAPLRADEIG